MFGGLIDTMFVWFCMIMMFLCLLCAGSIVIILTIDMLLKWAEKREYK